MKAKMGTYIKGISNDEYHSDKDFLSSSQLKKAIKSHGNFRYEMTKPKETPKWKKDNAMDFGSYVHALLLEPEVIEDEFAFIDIEGRSFRSKADKAWLAQALAQHEGKIVLPNCAKKRAQICVENALAHPFLRKMLEAPGDPEISGFYHDDFYDINLRIRPDKLITDLDGKSAILDIKTTADMDNFKKIANWDFHYDLSAHMYIVGDLAIRKELDVPFYFGVVESQSPHRVAVFKASDQFLVNGAKKYRNALSNVKIARGLPSDVVRYQEVDWQEI